MLTCRIFPGRPVMGAWVSYALGTENRISPRLWCMRDPEGYSTFGLSKCWTSGFLPALYQGVEFSSTGDTDPSPASHGAASHPAYSGNVWILR